MNGFIALITAVAYFTAPEIQFWDAVIIYVGARCIVHGAGG